MQSAVENELFEALEACDVLTDGWENENCYSRVFMENLMILKANPSHPPKYLKADQPLYPCTDVQTRYKNRCYERQTTYALLTQGNDFATVFHLCTNIEGDFLGDGFRQTCYQSLGRDAFGQSHRQSANDADRNESISKVCILGNDNEARSNCVAGAVKSTIYHFHDNAQAKTLCEALNADSRTACLWEGEGYYIKRAFNSD